MNKHVAFDEKLTGLRENDTHRRWQSLDDQRICILCGKLITGRMIDIWQDNHGTYRLHCPTPDCASKPRDWFYHGAMRTQRSKPLRQSPAIDFRLPNACAI